MIGAFYILAATLTIFVVFMIFQAVGGRLFGARVEELGIFQGSAILKIDLRGGLVFKLNYFPSGSYVRFTQDFSFLHPFRKILIILAGIGSYLTLAIIGLGFEETFHQILTGFGQIISGVFSPLTVGTKLIEALAILFTQGPFVVGIGVLAAKILVFNLLPLGSLSGGSLVLYVLELIGFSSEKFNERFTLFGLLVVLLIGIPWMVAIFMFLSRSYGA